MTDFENELRAALDLPDLWETLAESRRPVVLYGTGNGADKLIDTLAQYGIAPAGIFASEGFVRSRTFRGLPVESCAAVTERFPDAVILIAFGSSLPAVMGYMDDLAGRYTVRYPELPLFGGELFTRQYAREHFDAIAAGYSLLADDASRALYRELILYRLTGEMTYLSRTEDFAETLNLLPRGKIRTAADGGAFTGDTARAMCAAFPNLQRLYAAEPDARTFRKLSDYAETTGGQVVPLPYALGVRDEVRTIQSSGSRGSGLDGTAKRAKEQTVTVRALDSLLSEMCAPPLDLLKLDVEGAEADALAGAYETLKVSSPALIVSLYHRTADLWQIPLYLARNFPRYGRFSLRRAKCYPAWDVVGISNEE